MHPRSVDQIARDRAREEVMDAVRSLSPADAVAMLEDCLDIAKRARRHYEDALQ